MQVLREKVEFHLTADGRAANLCAGIRQSEPALARGGAEILSWSGCLGTREERNIGVVRPLVIEERVE